MKLVCINEFSPYFTEGKDYKVIREFQDNYEIIDDQGHEHLISKEPDDVGTYWETWFTLEK